MTGWIGVTLGDVTGIGPEVALKALAAEPDDGTRYLILGDPGVARHLNTQFQFGLVLEPFAGLAQPGRFFLHDPLNDPLPLNLVPGSPAAARAAVAWLTDGAHRCLRQELDALVTAPVSKEAVIRSGLPFVGQTELLARLAGMADPVMMLLGTGEHGQWLRVALATTHIPLRLVPDQLNPVKIEQVIARAAAACQALHLPQARIGVCGLNPHAGEGGELGREEITCIAPAIQACRQRGLEVAGPLAADSLFFRAYHGEFEVVVAMYHDQGLPPLKLIGFDSGVNWTLGLPFIRTSPDHGTAYELAGQNRARPGSMLAALHLAKQLARG